MAIAHDSVTRFPTSGTETTSGTRTWTHTPTGTPCGVAVFLLGSATTSALASAVSYGSATLTLQQSATVTTGGGAEANQRLEVWASVTNIPAGAQTVTVSGAVSTIHGFTSVAVTSDTGVASINTSGATDLTTSSQPRQSLTTTKDTMAYAACTTDANAPQTGMLSGCTLLATGFDWGS